LSENPDLILTKADKGNITVAMNTQDYKNKNLLNDTNTYTIVNKDSSQKLTNKVRMLLYKVKKI